VNDRARLTEIVGPANVLADDDMTAGYRQDWTGRFLGPSTVVVRPGTTDEAAAVIKACAETSTPVVPQGGNTGLVGGSVPLSGEVVLSLTRLNRIEPVDAAGGQVTADAGAAIAAVQHAAAQAGWAYGVDLASRDSATVGGTIATNAGGLRVLRYGDTRAQLVGIEAVLANGDIVTSLPALFRNNTGYHLPSLLCGSEGTLAVITKARLRLVPPAPHKSAALLRFATTDDAAAAAGQLRRGLASLAAVEFFLQAGLDLVCETFALAHPFAAATEGAYLLVEAASDRDPIEHLAAAVNALDGVADVAVATDSHTRAALWRYRELHTESINHVGPPHKLDVAVPVAALAELVARVPGVVHAIAPTAKTWLFGHAADGNVHINVTGLDPDDDRVDDAVFRLVADLGGSISAEHGIGTAKRRWLPLARTPAEIAAFRALKRAFDPAGILNPHVLLPDERR
jgi:FAD/FMN-containing dehydrogenase